MIFWITYKIVAPKGTVKGRGKQGDTTGLPPLPPRTGRAEQQEATASGSSAQHAADQLWRHEKQREECAIVRIERFGDRQNWTSIPIPCVPALVEIIERRNLMLNIQHLLFLSEELGGQDARDATSKYLQEIPIFRILITLHCDITFYRDAFEVY